MRTRARVLVFARPPVEGIVKTRLAAVVGPAAALAAYRACLARALSAAAGATGEFAVLAAEGPEAPLREALPPGARLEPQAEGDLGARLRAGFDGAFAAGSPMEGDRAIAIGADCPGVTSEDLLEAEGALDAADAVVGPAEDGGYWLVGVRRAAWPMAAWLFDAIPWSSEGVYEATRRRAGEIGITLAEIRTRYDIDTVEDLERALREGLL